MYKSFALSLCCSYFTTDFTKLPDTKTIRRCCWLKNGRSAALSFLLSLSLSFRYSYSISHIAISLSIFRLISFICLSFRTVFRFIFKCTPTTHSFHLFTVSFSLSYSPIDQLFRSKATLSFIHYI